MIIKSSSALRNEYDKLVQVAKETFQPIFITRNGQGEMVFLPIELWEQREAELSLMEKLLAAERNRQSGAPTFSTADVRKELEDLYGE